MHNVEYELMKTLVDFMYLGEVLVNQNNVDRLFKLAKTFNVRGFQNGFNKNEVSLKFKYNPLCCHRQRFVKFLNNIN